MPVASVGDRATATLEVPDEAIDDFAALTDDDNPLHTDAAYAEESLFGEPVAHGMLSAGAVSAALADLPGDVIYLSQEVEFLAPVHPGETLVAEVEAVEELGDGQLRVETVATTGEEPVLQGEAIVMSVSHGG